MAMNKNGIPILGKDSSLFVGLAEEVEEGEYGPAGLEDGLPVYLLVRCLVLGETKYLDENGLGQIGLVYNFTDCGRGNRDSAWGLPGGRVKLGEDVRVAVRRKMSEFSWPMRGDATYLLTSDRRVPSRKPARIERTLVFLIKVEEDRQIKIAGEEAKEVNRSDFFPITKLATEFAEANQRYQPEQSGQKEKIYRYHGELLAAAYAEYVAKGFIKTRT